MGSMSSFISIIKLENGAASYRVVAGERSGYRAYLVKNTSTASLPEELTIDSPQSRYKATGTNPVMDKLMTAILNNAFTGEDPV